MLCPSIGTGRTVSHELSRITHSLAQGVKNLPARQETQVWSLSQGGPLEKGMATHCSIFAWRIPWIKECGQLQSMGPQRVGHDWVTSTHIHFWRKIIWIIWRLYESGWRILWWLKQISKDYHWPWLSFIITSDSKVISHSFVMRYLIYVSCFVKIPQESILLPRALI